MNQLRACRPAVWLALAAMLLGAFAPTVSRALAAARSDGAPMVEVCTSEGPRWVPLAPTSADTLMADASHGQESALSLDHCPFCLLVAERLGPPPAASMHFFNAESGLATGRAGTFLPDLSHFSRLAARPARAGLRDLNAVRTASDPHRMSCCGDPLRALPLGL